jgi:hypothetical protein
MKRGLPIAFGDSCAFCHWLRIGDTEECPMNVPISFHVNRTPFLKKRRWLHDIDTCSRKVRACLNSASASNSWSRVSNCPGHPAVSKAVIDSRGIWHCRITAFYLGVAVAGSSGAGLVGGSSSSRSSSSYSSSPEAASEEEAGGIGEGGAFEGFSSVGKIRTAFWRSSGEGASQSKARLQKQIIVVQGPEVAELFRQKVD